MLSVLLALSLTVNPSSLTLDEALDKIRAARTAGDRTCVHVVVQGTNVLEKTFVLLPTDHDIVFEGQGKAVISGGCLITGWRFVRENIYEADLPRNQEGKTVFFDQLWVNGVRAPNARLPNTGYFQIKDPQVVAVSNETEKVVRYVESLIPTSAEAHVLKDIAPDALGDVSEHIVHLWSYARRIVRSVNRTSGRVTTYSPDGTPGWKRWQAQKTIVWYENVPTAFDAAGEWLLDRAQGKVFYRLLSDEKIEALSFVASRAGLSQLVAFKGDYAKGQFVQGITFRNITFCHADGTRTPDMQLGDENPDCLAAQGNGHPIEMWQLQAACGSDAAITLTGARNVRFEKCRVTHTGNYAFRFNSGCVSNTVVNCQMSDIGAGGIWMGSRLDCAGNGSPIMRKVLRPDRPDSTCYNLISNNFISGFGCYNPEGTGIALTHCSDSRILYNDITNGYYTGVSIGFTWGFRPSVSQRNEIAFNRIADLGQGVMSDMGGVYTLSTSFGTHVHDNVIHDIDSLRYGGWGLYCDEGSEGIILERNLCWNTADGGFHQHYGTGCIVRNNIFAFNRQSGAIKTRRREVHDIPCSVHVVANIVYGNSGELTGDGVLGVEGVWANNVWWDTRGKSQARFGKSSWSEWLGSGKETGGILADPLFVNAAKLDFRLQPNSPAFSRGFKPWDYSRAGCHLDGMGDVNVDAGH